MPRTDRWAKMRTPVKDGKKKMVSFGLDAEPLARLDAICDKEDRTRAYILALLLTPVLAAPPKPAKSAKAVRATPKPPK